MLLVTDIAAGLVLRLLDAARLFARDEAVALGPALDLMDALLLGPQSVRLRARELAAALAFTNAVGLASFTKSIRFCRQLSS